MNRMDKFLIVAAGISVVCSLIVVVRCLWLHLVWRGCLMLFCLVVNTVTLTTTLCGIHYMKREAALIERIKTLRRGKVDDGV